jgi:hypothetical protein
VGAKFPRYFKEEKLRNLRWGEPTTIANFEISGDDILQLMERLRVKNKHFFVFPDFTFFYALLGVPSPQPVLWFDLGLTYPYVYDESLDKWIVQSLKKNAVEMVVIEENSYKHKNNTLGQREGQMGKFPQLKSYLMDNFNYTGRIGIFMLYEKKAN